MRATDYADACPIETVALEVASTNEPLRQATAEVFESWIEGATERFRAAGIGDRTARELSMSLIALLEELHTQGQTVLLVTHDAAIAAHAGRSVRMRDGRVVD